MSVQCGVICLDCREDAPPVGDGGFVGAPSLEITDRTDYQGWNTLPSFAWLYEALAAVHIQTYELDQFQEWLRRHRGHRITLHADIELPSPELSDIFDEWHKIPKRELVAKDRERHAAAEQARADGFYVLAAYEAECEACGETIASPEPELLRSFEPATLPIAAIGLYLERWDSNAGRTLAWRLMSPLVNVDDSFVPDLQDFFKRHREHGITVRANVS